jgi:hypothetical protein
MESFNTAMAGIYSHIDLLKNKANKLRDKISLCTFPIAKFYYNLKLKLNVLHYEKDINRRKKEQQEHRVHKMPQKFTR